MAAFQKSDSRDFLKDSKVLAWIKRQAESGANATGASKFHIGLMRQAFESTAGSVAPACGTHPWRACVKS
jgi:hypothetical protein